MLLTVCLMTYWSGFVRIDSRQND